MPYGFHNSSNQNVSNMSHTVPTIHRPLHNDSRYFRVPFRKPFNNYQNNKRSVNISARSKAKILKKSKIQRLKAAKRRKANTQSSEQQNNFKRNLTRKRTVRKAKKKTIDGKYNPAHTSRRSLPTGKPKISDITPSTQLVSAWLTNNFETPFSHGVNPHSQNGDTIDQCSDAVVPLYAAGCPSDLRNVEHGATSFTLPDNLSMWSGLESSSLIGSQEPQYSKPNEFDKLLTPESLLQLEKEELVSLVLSLQKQILSDNNRVSASSNEHIDQPNKDVKPSVHDHCSEPCISEISMKTEQELNGDGTCSPGDISDNIETVPNVSEITQEQSL
ncbi:uncharacterized protein LOC115211816 [Argonauta hians]